MTTETKVTFNDICEELGLSPPFLFGLSEDAASQYETFDLPKRSGGFRTISVPSAKLKRVQRLILDGLLTKFTFPPHVHGCVKGRSIVTNAAVHVDKPLVINIDLRNFFGCVGFHWVVDVFESVFNCEAGTAKILARLCTYGNFLPQGAPTSPYLANICALDLDEKIFQICRENFKDYEFDYSRYVDDITISGDRKLMFYLGDFYRAIKSCGFSANPKKLKIAKPSSRQKVTGVVVNKKLNAPKKLIRKIRQQLHYCTKYGLVNHCAHQKIEPDNFFQEIFIFR